MRNSSIGVAVLTFMLFGCREAPKVPEKREALAPPEQDLPITFGGFTEGHPERGELNGVCGTDETRNVLNCDIYNGLLDWTVTEITLGVTWAPYNDDDKRYYRETVSIPPLKTGQVSIRLGMQLPLDSVIKYRAGPPTKQKHWSWLIAGARGSPRPAAKE